MREIFPLLIISFLVLPTYFKMLKRQVKHLDPVPEQPERKIDSSQEPEYSGCFLQQTCRICTYSELLTEKECEKSGYIELLDCDSIKGVKRSCASNIFVPRLVIFGIFCWGALFIGLRLLGKYKRQLEQEGLSKLARK